MEINKRGISLIVLVITIIVMIILAAGIIISLDNSNLINRANEAVDLSDVKQVQHLASIIWAEAYLEEEPNIDEKYIIDELLKEGVNTDKFNITVAENGVIVTLKQQGESGGEEEPTKYYTITFNTNGGSAVASQSIEENGKVAIPSRNVKKWLYV